MKQSLPTRMLPPKELTEIAKNSFDIVKSAVVLLVVAVVLLWPNAINVFLDRLNVLKIEFGGITMDRTKAIEQLAALADRLPKAEADLTTAKDELNALKSAYERVIRTLKETEDVLRTLRVDSSVTKQLPNAAVTSGDIIKLQQTVQSAIKLSAPVLANAIAASENVTSAAATTKRVVAVLPRSNEAAGFAIIFGGDATVEAATVELNKAKSLEFQSAQVFLRQKRFRSAVVFLTRDEAEAAMEKVKGISLTARQAYIVDLSSWCPAPQTRQSEGFLDCGF